MIKTLIFSTLFMLNSSAKTIHFSEEKYYEALEKSFSQEGNITFSDESIEIVYFEDKRKLLYTEDQLKIDKEGEKKTIDLSDKPEISIFFKLFRAIYFNDQETLNTFFTTEKLKELTILSPLPLIAKHIKKVNYKKTEKKLIFLDILFSSEDRIHIEELD